ERRDVRNQGVLEPELVPEILSYPPALDIRDDQEEHEGHGGGTRKQAEREQGAGDELRERDRGRPELAGTIAIVVELRREFGEVVRTRAGLGEEPEGVAQAVRDEREADGGAQRC